MPDNPLTVIGVTADDLKHTSLDRAASLVEIVGKARLRFEHPDAGGDTHRFQAVRDAMQQLKRRDTLKQAIQELRQPHRTKVTKLEEKLHDAEQAERFAARRAEAFMLATATSASWSIYHPGMIIRLRDVLRANQSQAISGPHVSQLFVSLTATHGQLIASERSGKRKPRQNRLLGCLHQEDVPAPFSHAMDFILACHPTAVHQALPTQPGAKSTASSTGNFLSWNRAKPLRSLLRPELGQQAIVFSYRDGDEPGLLIEGQFLDAKTADPA